MSKDKENKPLKLSFEVFDSNGNKIELDNKMDGIPHNEYIQKQIDFSNNRAQVQKRIDEELIPFDQRRHNIEKPSNHQWKKLQEKIEKLAKVTGNYNTTLEELLTIEEMKHFNAMMNPVTLPEFMRPFSLINKLLAFNFEDTNQLLESRERILFENLKELSENVLTIYIEKMNFSKAKFIKDLMTMPQSIQDKHFRKVRWLLQFYPHKLKNKKKIRSALPKLFETIKSNKGKKPVEDLDLLCSTFAAMQDLGIISLTISETASMIHNQFMTFKSKKTIENYLKTGKKYIVEIKTKEI